LIALSHRNDSRDRFSMAGHDNAPPLSDTAQEFGESAIRVGGRDSFFTSHM